jgi:uncharacterized protein YdeI (YjbR/CyaY-like superfamily)
VDPKVDAYIERSTAWPAELRAARSVLLGCGLTEQLKWGKPCYSHDGANIVILQEMKGFLALMFFKGALLTDPNDMLHEQGPNSRSARRMQLTSAAEITECAAVIAAYVAEAVRVEQAGLTVAPAPELELVPELRDRLDRDAVLRTAFEALTPGRQREYHLAIAGAKQSSTRVARIERYAPRILAGRGLRD